MLAKCRLALLVPFAAVLALGCSGKGNPNAPAKVSGKVTYKGEAVGGGTITFCTKDAGTYPFPLDSKGNYSGSELPAGDMTVLVETESINPNKKQPAYGGGRGPSSSTPEGANTKGDAKYVKIPAKYSTKEKSDLKVTLKAGSNDNDFDLKD